MKVIFTVPEVTYQLASAPKLTLTSGNAECTAATLSISGQTEFTVDTEITGLVKIMSDDDMDLQEFDSTGFLRHEVTYFESSDKTTLVFTNDEIPEPVEPEEPVEPTEEELLAAAKAGRSETIESRMNECIAYGVLLDTEYGYEHFTLSSSDQTLLIGVSGLLLGGTEYYPYHSVTDEASDDPTCNVYSAADLSNICNLSFAHITYHQSYESMLQTWLTRETDTDVVYTIEYGVDLPDDLNEYLLMLMTAAGVSEEYFPVFIAAIAATAVTEPEDEFVVEDEVVEETVEPEAEVEAEEETEAEVEAETEVETEEEVVEETVEPEVETEETVTE